MRGDLCTAGRFVAGLFFVWYNAYKHIATASPSLNSREEERILSDLIIRHNELSAEEFVYLWESVWGQAPTLEQAKLATDNTLFRVSVFDGDQIAAMARVIGDLGLCYYIKDVVVSPDYQGKGIGRLLINELLKFVNENGVPDTRISVELCAMPDKIPFYEKFGFAANEAQRLRIMYPVEKQL